MKRYIVFAFDQYERENGAKGIFGVASTEEEMAELIKRAKQSPACDCIEVYDIESESVVKTLSKSEDVVTRDVIETVNPGSWE